MPVVEIFEAPGLIDDHTHDRTRLQTLKHDLKSMTIEDMEELLIDVEEAIISIEHQLKASDAFEIRGYDWFLSAETALKFKRVAKEVIFRRMKRLKDREKQERLDLDRDEAYRFLASADFIPKEIRRDMVMVRIIRDNLPADEFQKLMSTAKSADTEGWAWIRSSLIPEANDDQPADLTGGAIVANAG